ncbi:hypothetical protein [Endozoicomonas sp. SESOKO1]|nr:hypothetical protein [Endozoicomonas sp. SESOKO1]
MSVARFPLPEKDRALVLFLFRERETGNGKRLFRATENPQS